MAYVTNVTKVSTPTALGSGKTSTVGNYTRAIATGDLKYVFDGTDAYVLVNNYETTGYYNKWTPSSGTKIMYKQSDTSGNTSTIIKTFTTSTSYAWEEKTSIDSLSIITPVKELDDVDDMIETTLGSKTVYQSRTDCLTSDKPEKYCFDVGSTTSGSERPAALYKYVTEYNAQDVVPGSTSGAAATDVTCYIYEKVFPSNFAILSDGKIYIYEKSSTGSWA